MNGDFNKSGYRQFRIHMSKNSTKNVHINRFVWECFNGLINDKKVVFHINKDPKDNRLKNLKLTTMSDIAKEVYNPTKSRNQNL